MKVKKRVRGREVVEGQSTNSERHKMRKERGKREERPKALRRRKV
jgi:hypothetical protein